MTTKLTLKIDDDSSLTESQKILILTWMYNYFISLPGNKLSNNYPKCCELYAAVKESFLLDNCVALAF